MNNFLQKAFFKDHMFCLNFAHQIITRKGENKQLNSDEGGIRGKFWNKFKFIFSAEALPFFSPFFTYRLCCSIYLNLALLNIL